MEPSRSFSLEHVSPEKKGCLEFEFLGGWAGTDFPLLKGLQTSVFAWGGREGGQYSRLVGAVLAMLALFAVVALSFVLYAESEATSMRNGRAARNGEADPNPQEAANQFLGVLICDTNDNSVALYGHGLGTTKYGQVPGQMYSPYAGSGLPAEDVSGAIGLSSIKLTRPFRYTLPIGVPSSYLAQIFSLSCLSSGFGYFLSNFFGPSSAKNLALGSSTKSALIII